MLSDEVIADKLSEFVAEYKKLPLSDFEKHVMNKKAELDKITEMIILKLYQVRLKDLNEVTIYGS